VLAGHHQPLRVWVLCLYFMGLNLSNRQIAGELGLAVSDVQAMTEQLRQGLVAKAPEVELKGEVEPDARASSGIDEVYVVAGYKGQPDEVSKRGGSGAWFRICAFRVTQACGDLGPWGPDFDWGRVSCAGGGRPLRVKLAGAEAVPGPAGSASADGLGRSSARAGSCPGARHAGCAGSADG